MVAHSIAISRGLEAAGIQKQHADAIAEAVVTHSDESVATKADIARLEGKMDALSAELGAESKALSERVKLLTNLVMGLYLGLALLIVDRLSGQ